ncbi:hypothetical protein GJ496_010936 [Pomphorhynchus laevis]|nr:hypothetical protein GJ496_010936 [Pomphorhynchus laevis]
MLYRGTEKICKIMKSIDGKTSGLAFDFLLDRQSFLKTYWHPNKSSVLKTLIRRKRSSSENKADCFTRLHRSILSPKVQEDVVNVVTSIKDSELENKLTDLHNMHHFEVKRSYRLARIVYPDVVCSDIDESVSKCREKVSVKCGYDIGEIVLVKPPNARCTTLWFKGAVKQIILDVTVAINGIPRHISDIRHIVEPKISVQNENERKQLRELNDDSDTGDLILLEMPESWTVNETLR